MFAQALRDLVMDLSKPLAQIAVCLPDTNPQLFTLPQSIAHAKADQHKPSAGLTYKGNLYRYLKESELGIQPVPCSKCTQFTAVQQLLLVCKHLL